MTVRNKLFAGFGLLLLVFGVTVAFANVQLNSVGASEEDVFARDLDLTWKASQLRLELRHLRGEAIQYVLAPPEEKERYEGKIMGVEGKVDAAIADIRATGCLTPAQIAEIDAIDASAQRYYLGLASEVVGRIRAGEVDAAIDETFGNIGDSKANFKTALNGAGDFAGGVSSNAVASHDVVTSTLNSTKTALFAMSGIAILAAVGITIFLSNSIAGRVDRLTVVADKLSQGEVDGLEIDVTGDGEIGRLGESLQGVLAAFELMRDEAMRNEAKAESEAA